MMLVNELEIDQPAVAPVVCVFFQCTSTYICTPSVASSAMRSSSLCLLSQSTRRTGFVSPGFRHSETVGVIRHCIWSCILLRHIRHK